MMERKLNYTEVAIKINAFQNNIFLKLIMGILINDGHKLEL